MRPAALLVLLALSPAPPAEAPLRDALAAAARGDYPSAESLLRAAAESTAEPGLVALNRGAAALAQERPAEAEAYYSQALSDAALAPELAARAGYDRGTCRARLAKTSPQFLAALADLERCLASPAATAELRLDARNNLEVVKLLLAEARRRERVPPPPPPPQPPPPTEAEQPPPDVAPRPMPEQPQSGEEQAPARPPAGKPPESPSDPPPAEPPGPASDSTRPPPPGSGRLPPISDREPAPPLTPEEARAWLRRAELRLQSGRRERAKLTPARDAADVRDW